MKEKEKALHAAAVAFIMSPLLLTPTLASISHRHIVSTVSVASLWLILPGWCRVATAVLFRQGWGYDGSSRWKGKDVGGIRMKMKQECERKMTQRGDVMKQWRRRMDGSKSAAAERVKMEEIKKYALRVKKGVLGVFYWVWVLGWP